MKKENYIKTLYWPVKYYDCNSHEIKTINILKNKEKLIKKYKKNYDRPLFSELLRREISYNYAGRCEYELIITRGNESIWLSDLFSETYVNVINDTNFDWKEFYAFCENLFCRTNGGYKFSIYEQLIFKWEEFIDYLWNSRLPHERKRKE